MTKNIQFSVRHQSYINVLLRLASDFRHSTIATGTATYGSRKRFSFELFRKKVGNYEGCRGL